jgi:hypothetical protein
MTRFEFRCRKAALLLLALGLAVLCALFNPGKAQSVQSLVKNQPFPFAQGVAMDTVLFKSIKAKLEAAEALRNSSVQTIAALQAEITGMEALLKTQQALATYDAHTVDSLRLAVADRKARLDTATVSLSLAKRAIDDVVQVLPRPIRKILKTAPPDQVASAIVDYIHTLQKRKWNWAGASALAGIVLTLTAHFF